MGQAHGNRRIVGFWGVWIEYIPWTGITYFFLVFLPCRIHALMNFPSLYRSPMTTALPPSQGKTNG